MFNLKSLLVATTVAIASATNSTHAANNCVSFSIGQGTGCAWMCEYCATTLGTSNYYFTTPVCAYQTGGCIGNPQPGVTYTCCGL